MPRSISSSITDRHATRARARSALAARCRALVLCLSFVAPGLFAQGFSVSGTVFHSGSPITTLTNVTPQFVVTDVANGAVITGYAESYDNASGDYVLSGLPALFLQIEAIFLVNGPSASLPGNFRGSGNVDLTPGYDLGLSLFVRQSMRLRQPADNSAVTTSQGNFPTHLQNVTFSWDPVPNTTSYDVTVARYRSSSHPLGYGFVANVDRQSQPGTSWSTTLPASLADEHYQAAIQALDIQSARVGEVWTTYTNGAALDHHFRVATQPPQISLAGPATTQVGTSVSLAATAANCSPDPAGWQWNLDGGTASGSTSGSQVVVSWPTAGTRSVTASNPLCGAAAGTLQVDVASTAQFRADFRVDPAAPVRGQQVRFFDQSVGAVSAWSWTFGDGGSSTERNPRHTYTHAGVYSVALTITGAGVSDTLVRNVVVSSAGNAAEFTGVRFGAVEGGGGVTVTVRRAVASPSAASVTVRVIEGSAKLGQDVAGSPSRSVFWGANDSSTKTVTIPLMNDQIVEGSETFEVVLENPQGMSLGTARRATVVVADDDFRVTGAETLSANGENPVVAHSRGGKVAFAWQEPDGNGYGVFARVLAPDGSVLSPTTRLHRGRRGNQVQPAITFVGERLVAVWIDEGTSASTTADGFIVSAARQGGNAVGAFLDPVDVRPTDPVVVSPPGDAATGPQVAADENGGIVVAWQDGGVARGRTYQDDLSRPGAVFALDQQAGVSQLALDRASTGDFVAVWRSGSQGVRGRVFRPTGQARGPAFTVSGAATAARPDVAVRGDGRFTVVWEQGPEGGRTVRSRRFNRVGKATGAASKVGRLGASDQFEPAIDMNDAGDTVVVWQVALGARASSAGQNTVGAFLEPDGAQIGDEVPVAAGGPAGDPEDADVSIAEDDTTEVVLRLSDPAGRSTGILRRTLQPSLVGGPCVQDETTLCLQDGRFRVTTEWEAPVGGEGTARVQEMTGDTGVVWFFAAENVELVVKVLDGCGVNGRHWVFAGGLTDVEVKLRVDDTLTGDSKVYSNRPNRPFTALQDTDAFRGCSGQKGEGQAKAAALPARVASAACAPGALCLANGRFVVEATWRAPGGASGQGVPVPYSRDTGMFWFFDEANLELVVKVLDGCALNRRYWVFAGGLTNVRVDLRVTDVARGTTVTYRNPLGRVFVPIQDTDALSGCR